MRRWLSVDGGRDQRVGLVRLGNPRRAVEDEGRGDVRLVEQQLGLQQLELEADRPQILAQQEVHVLEGEPIGGMLGLRAGGRLGGGLGFFAGRGERRASAGRVGHSEPLSMIRAKWEPLFRESHGSMTLTAVGAATHIEVQ